MSEEDATRAPGAPLADQKTLDLTVSDQPERQACLLEVHGDHVGRRFDLIRNVVRAGRGDDVDLQISSLAVSREHAEIRRDSRGWLVQDLDSTNGTFVDEHRVGSAVLEHGNVLRLGATLFRFFHAEDLDDQIAEELDGLAQLDGVTRTRHRAAFGQELDVWFEQDRPFALVLLVIDRFPEIAARMHEQAAENAVSLVAGLLRARLRRGDVIGRVGEASFGILLGDVSEPRAGRIADNLCRQVTLSSFEIGDAIVPIRAVAVVTGRRPDDAPDRMLARATLAVRQRAEV